METLTFHILVRGQLKSEVYGHKLSPGDVIENEDVMDTLDGTWQKVPQELVGDRLQENPGAIIVRKAMTT